MGEQAIKVDVQQEQQRRACVYMRWRRNARLRFVPVQVAGKTKPGAALLVSGEEGSSDNECR